MITGLEPKNFTWVIADRLALSDRIGGNGFQHRKVRRDEEVTWLINVPGITTVISLLEANQNLSSYQERGMGTIHIPLSGSVDATLQKQFNEALGSALANPDAVVLVHRETIDDQVSGLIGGYLLHARLIETPVLAVAVIQEIVGRALGPEGRALVRG